MSNKKPIPDEQVHDSTQAIIQRCEPIVKKIMEMMLAENLMLTDSKYIQSECIRQLDTLCRNIVIDHGNVVFKMMQDTINIAFEQATKRYWKKDQDEITVKDVEDKFNE